MADNLKAYIKPKIADNVQGSKNKGKKKRSTLAEAEDKEARPVSPTVQEFKTSKKKNKEYASKYLKNFVTKVREECWCEAATHGLINNCLNCGRIVCEKEGSGSCFTCKRLVCTGEEMKKLKEKTKESDLLFYQLMSGPMSHIDSDDHESLNLKTYFEMEGEVYEENENALALKDKLLQYDLEAAKRTQIIDDESDYFNITNKWMNKKQREHMQNKFEQIQAKKHQSRLDAKYQINLLSGQVEEVKVEVNIEKEAQDAIIQEALYGRNDTIKGEVLSQPFQLLPELDIAAPKFIPSEIRKTKPSSKHTTRSSQPSHRIPKIQDPELMEMSDEGLTLTLHQPYASLLIAGIKIHEGREWYSHHRGRLWIHAAGRPVSQEEIQAQEDFFRHIMGDIAFPKEYPLGRLLGCVNVKDCLDQEEYSEKFPDGYSQSSYVFICENPLPLKIKIPMKGSPKIYPLEEKIHKKAMKFLLID